MSLSIGGTLADALGRFATRNGLVLLVVYVLIYLPYQLSVNGLVSSLGTGAVLAYPAPLPVYAVVALACLVGLGALTVVALRTFVGDHAGSIPRELYTRRMAGALVHLFVGGIIYVLAMAVGLVLLVVPGLVIYVGFAFVTPYIAVEDDGVLTAFKRSWRLAREDFLRLGVLLAVVFVAALVVGFVAGFVLGLGGTLLGVPPGVTQLLVSLFNAPTTMFTLALLSAAFVRLRAQAGDGPSTLA